MIFLIDNYDSFVFNLARYFEELGHAVRVERNDALSLNEIERLNPSAIVVSPGPCTPAESGVSEAAIRHFAGTIPILGVCLGHQAIATAFGGTLKRDHQPMHGRTSLIQHRHSSPLFAGLPDPLRVTRYHSLVVDPSSLPEELRVTSSLDDGTIMALEHKQHPIWGVQFHPESVLSVGGHRLLENFLHQAGLKADPTARKEPFFDSAPPPEIGQTFPIMRPVSW